LQDAQLQRDALEAAGCVRMYCGDMPPTETETAYYAQTEPSPPLSSQTARCPDTPGRFSVSCCRGCGGRVAVKVVMASATACGLRRGKLCPP